MFRILIWFGLAVMLAVAVSGSVLAADGSSWPEYPFSGDIHKIDRGPSGYLSWIKLLACWILFLLWVRTTDWVNEDCQLLGLPYAIWNPIVFFPFLVGLFIFAFSMPVFLFGIAVALLSWCVPSLSYVVKRNSAVEPHERVLTPGHLRYLFAHTLNKVGVKVSAEKMAAHEKGAPVVLMARGGETPQHDQANMIAARQSPGYITAKELIATAVDHRADKVMLDFNSQSVPVRRQVDGVWHDAESRERDESDVMLAVLKKLAALNEKERRARQEGNFVAEYEGGVYDSVIVSQGTKTGERIMIQFVRQDQPFRKLDATGMREKMREQLIELLRREKGVLLFSSMPSGGLSTTVAAATRASDRYMRDHVAVLDELATEPQVENVEIVRYNGRGGETPAKLLPTVIRRQPDVLVVPELPNAETVKILCQAVQDHEKMVLTTMRAKEAVEALLRVLLLKVPSTEFAPAVIAAVNQRLIRKLCDVCKEAYTPPPELLKKLGIPAGRVQSLYRPPENPEEVCKTCEGLGYRERTSIYELLVVDDKIRQALVKQPKLDVLRKVSREVGNRGLQEEGLVLVVQGITSLPELMRVLKQ